MSFASQVGARVLGRGMVNDSAKEGGSEGSDWGTSAGQLGAGRGVKRAPR